MQRLRQLCLLLALLCVVGALSIYINSRQTQVTNLAMQRLSDAIAVKDLASGAVAQYEAQADCIINQHTDTKDYDEASKFLAGAKKHYAELADTAEKKAWSAEIDKADDEFDATFHKEILPRVARMMAAKEPA